jgi:hypothetical protein
MLHTTLHLATLTVLLVASSWGAAFQWEPFDFPPGDQAYTFEIVLGDGSVTTVDVTMTAVGDGYDVATTMTTSLRGVRQGDLTNALFGAGAMGMFGFGPMLLFGPSSMMLPMLLGSDDIAVRDEPSTMPGFGSLSLEREEIVAGHRCVVMRLVLDNAPDDSIEFAVAEGVPIPCFSRYGSGGDAIEMRLLRAE